MYKPHAPAPVKALADFSRLLINYPAKQSRSGSQFIHFQAD